MNLLKIAGDEIAILATTIHAKEDAKTKVRIIASLLEQRYGITGAKSLSSGEIQLLAELTSGRKIQAIARAKKVRRDTVSRQLAITREKLNIGSNKELISALRPYQNTYRHGDTS